MSPDDRDQRDYRDHDNAEENSCTHAHTFFPAIKERSIGSRRKATPVAA